jgi:hypothetical protein
MKGTYTFGFTAAGQTPEGPGVYTIFSRSHWIYVGESDNIRRSLLDHLNGSAPSLDGYGPLSFSFEPMAGGDRSARWRTLVTDLKPACNGPAAVTHAVR